MTKQERAKDRRLQKLFRTTLEEYSKIEEFQKKSKFKILLGKKNGYDHHHASGRCRGILDWRLNRALGLVESVAKNEGEAAEILRVLSEYLVSPPAVEVLGERFGLIGQAKVKKKMIYGSKDGPILPPKKRRKKC